MKYYQVAKMNFPISILPSYIVVSKFYSHLVILGIITLICFIAGFTPSIYLIQLLIFIPYALLLSISIAIFTSTLNVIIRDTQMIIQALMRMLFFVSSILYLPDNKIVINIIKYNPIYFLAEGYRSAILYKEWFFINNWDLVIYNLVFLLITFIIGSYVNFKYRDYFSDFM